PEHELDAVIAGHELSKSATKKAMKALTEAMVARLKAKEAKAAADDPRPVIVVTTDVHEAVAAGITALARDEDVFARGNQLVRVMSGQEGTIQHPITAATLKSVHLSRVARWTQPDGIAIKPPDDVAKAIYEVGDYPGVRELVTISDTPIMRPDGTILFERGYDAATKTILEPSVTIKVPDSPTMEDAFQARDRLMTLLVDFPLVESAAGVWFSLLFTHFGRHMIDGPTPAVIVDGN